MPDHLQDWLVEAPEDQATLQRDAAHGAIGRQSMLMFAVLALHYTTRPTDRTDRRMVSPLAQQVRGYIYLLCSAIVLFLYLLTGPIAKLFPARIVPESAEYYTLLVPLLLPVGFFFVYTNWLGLKLFRHN